MSSGGAGVACRPQVFCVIGEVKCVLSPGSSSGMIGQVDSSLAVALGRLAPALWRGRAGCHDGEEESFRRRDAGGGHDQDLRQLVLDEPQASVFGTRREVSAVASLGTGARPGPATVGSYLSSLFQSA